jgi:hypothetical protein
VNSGGSPGIASFVTTGDYDEGGEVDALDYLVWRGDFGSTVTEARDGSDGNKDGFVNAADYVIWRDHLTLSGGFSAGNGGESSASSGAEIGTVAATERATLPPIPRAFLAGSTWQTPITQSHSESASSPAADSSDRLLLLLANDRVRRALEEKTPRLYSKSKTYSDKPTDSVFSLEGALVELGNDLN